MTFRAPVGDFRFMLEHIAPIRDVAAFPRFADAGTETCKAIMAEAARMCEDVLVPLQRKGDEHPARLENGVVRTSPGFAEGYRAIANGGWVGMAASPEYGGMGLPMSLVTLVNEMMASACLSLQLSPLMSQGQIEALESHAADEVKTIFLPRLISGEWTGTMNLTEPQAGSDVGALRCSATPNGDGTHAVRGQKIFISWGDNDFSDNVCHLVLARLSGAPPGTRGISLFIVPKGIPDATGKPGPANALRVVSLERKMGLHGSPTAVMEYDGATGWLVGEPNAGMKAMFTMMNNARLGVGGQGIGVAEAAFQQGLGYAVARVQGRSGSQRPDTSSGAIVDHPDVRRMLAEMKSSVFAARAVALYCARAIDFARATGDPKWESRAALLTPIAKAYGTETGIEVADLNIQVHGGTGYIEGTGAAQYLRDARVTAIYEGTNGIQALDLVNRKLAADGGRCALVLCDEIGMQAGQVGKRNTDLAPLAGCLSDCLGHLRETTAWMVGKALDRDRNAAAVPFLRAFARVLGAHAHLTAANVAGADSARGRLAAFFIRRQVGVVRQQLATARQGYGDLDGLSHRELSAA